eukprot:TRINITY_DN11645_c0_g1_i1.p1 TRINITY_DN11645_c0_g1~~TRINITY_DN11645_c0_g1_i1.p1  ORF type:complete len:371 (+),score=117.51 TRINITY_DN11645_c0_g1_i1:48-1160(+)
MAPAKYEDDDDDVGRSCSCLACVALGLLAAGLVLGLLRGFQEWKEAQDEMDWGKATCLIVNVEKSAHRRAAALAGTYAQAGAVRTTSRLAKRNCPSYKLYAKVVGGFCVNGTDADGPNATLSPTLAPTVRSPSAARRTVNNCTCSQKWYVTDCQSCDPNRPGSSAENPCTDSCCNPNKDSAGDWCFVVDTACEPNQRANAPCTPPPTDGLVVHAGNCDSMKDYASGSEYDCWVDPTCSEFDPVDPAEKESRGLRFIRLGIGLMAGGLLVCCLMCRRLYVWHRKASTTSHQYFDFDSPDCGEPLCELGEDPMVYTAYRPREELRASETSTAAREAAREAAARERDVQLADLAPAAESIEDSESSRSADIAD